MHPLFNSHVGIVIPNKPVTRDAYFLQKVAVTQQMNDRIRERLRVICDQNMFARVEAEPLDPD